MQKHDFGSLKATIAIREPRSDQQVILYLCFPFHIQ